MNKGGSEIQANTKTISNPWHTHCNMTAPKPGVLVPNSTSVLCQACSDVSTLLPIILSTRQKSFPLNSDADTYSGKFHYLILWDENVLSFEINMVNVYGILAVEFGFTAQVL